jgi:SAM-dependent methyltransferase
VAAVDLDETMVELARRRLHRRAVSLSAGEVCNIQQPGASHDTVVDFGIIHHVPQWQQAIAVIARVLRPGGQLLFEEAPATCSTSGHSAHSPSSQGKPLRGGRIAAELARHGLHGTADRTTPRRTALRRSRPKDMARNPTQTPHRRGRTRPAWPFATTKAAHDVRRHRLDPRRRVRAARRPSAGQD